MKLILMRGVSGSGKSTVARELAQLENSVICSTDDYFMVEGKYVFEPRMIGANHSRNQERARDSMKNRIPLVIIDNTNTQAWEMIPYVQAALEHGYQIEIHEPEPVSLEEIMRRQESRDDKNLPLEIVERMIARFEKVTVENLIEMAMKPGDTR
jgi:predicted kinase